SAVEGWMATADGSVPTPTDGVTRFCVRSITEAVPAPELVPLAVLLATTARPNRGITATPVGALPTAIVCVTWPNVVDPGVRSMTAALLQQLRLTMARSSGWPPMTAFSPMATPVGCTAVQPVPPRSTGFGPAQS